LTAKKFIIPKLCIYIRYDLADMTLLRILLTLIEYQYFY